MLVDVTLGVIVSWSMVRFSDILFGKLKVDSMVSGNYFVLRKINGKREYFISYSRWSWQCALWCLFAAIVD